MPGSSTVVRRPPVEMRIARVVASGGDVDPDRFVALVTG
jgi:hypothetical protein